MAKNRYISYSNSETWESVAKLFGQWLVKNNLAEGFGWSEGDALEIDDNTKLFCFSFPNHHGKKINLFEEWAVTTNRLYGIENQGNVFFPHQPDLTIKLTNQKTVEVPPWLR